MMGLKKTVSAGLAAALLLAMVSVSRADLNPATMNPVNIAGATLFKDYFSYGAATNDYIDANRNGIAGRLGSTVTEQLAPSWDSGNSTGWLVQYFGIGSGNGLLALVNPPPVSGPLMGGAYGDPSRVNRTLIATGGVISAPGSSANPGGGVNPSATFGQIDMAVMDVPTKWFIQSGGSTSAAWNKKPGQDGYGQNPVKSATGQGNTLKVLPAGYTLAADGGTPNNKTLYDTQVAWVTGAIVANRGVGTSSLAMSDLQHLYVTGRLPSGENLVAATREPGSGTRNLAMNSIAVDPSYGVGDNLGSKMLVDNGANGAAGTVSTFLGAGFQPTNLNSTGQMIAVAQNNRLAVGYAGVTDVQNQILGGQIEVLGITNDVVGGTAVVRPTLTAIMNNSNPNTGYRIGGAETYVTIGDPNATAILNQNGTTYKASSGNPTMSNAQAALFIRNTTESIAGFANGTSDTNNGMPGQILAYKFMLNAAVDQLPGNNPTVYSANTGKVQGVQDYSTQYNTLNVPAYGTRSVAGYVPSRSNATYSDGMYGNVYRYLDTTGATQTISGGNKLLSAANAVTADFNHDGKRDVNDIAGMMEAMKNPAAFSGKQNFGGNSGDMTGDYIIPEVIGDFNGDGNFDKKDVRYFADGLAMTGGTLNRKVGFTNVDNEWKNQTGTLNYFGTTIANPGHTYKAGDSRGDVAGNAVTLGGAPTGADGKVDAKDIDYVFAQINKAGGSGNWKNLDQASKFDLSADMNGDLVVDHSDADELVKVILGTNYGDSNLDGKVDVLDLGILATNWQKTGQGWANADFNGDGVVDVLDLGILATNWQATGGSFEAAAASLGLIVPEPMTMTMLVLGGAALLRRRKA